MNAQSGRKQIVSISIRVIDLASLVIALFIAVAIVTYPSTDFYFADFPTKRIKIFEFFILVGFSLICLIILKQCGLYQSRRLSSSEGEIVDILRATLYATAILLIITELNEVKIVDKTFLVIFWSSFSLMIFLNRTIARFIAKELRLKGQNLRFIVIIGTNDRAMNFAKMIESRPELGYCVLGFIDDPWPENGQIKNASRQVIATIDELPSFLRKNPIDEAIVCLPLCSFYHEVAKIVEFCETQGIVVRIPADFFNPVLAQSKIDHFENEVMITIQAGAMHGWTLMVKRGFDVVASAFLLVVLSPLLAITWVLIKLTSPGPVLFVQDRIGFNKRIFKMYKFRTMVVDAEKKQADLEKFNEVSGPVFKIKQDPRITPIGKFLRKFSIDELPQIFNVLKGDMSLVGPRPLPIRDYQGFSEDWHRRRFSVRPGITCLWQIKGRSNVSFETWMELDMQYIDQWSLWLDAKILLGTFFAVVKGSGAA